MSAQPQKPIVSIGSTFAVGKDHLTVVAIRSNYVLMRSQFNGALIPVPHNVVQLAALDARGDCCHDAA